MQPQPEPRTVHLAGGSPPVELVLHPGGEVTWRVPERRGQLAPPRPQTLADNAVYEAP